MHAYQIAIFANAHDSDAAVLRSLLEQRRTELGVDMSAVVFLDETTMGSRDKGRGWLSHILEATVLPLRLLNCLIF